MEALLSRDWDRQTEIETETGTDLKIDNANFSNTDDRRLYETSYFGDSDRGVVFMAMMSSRA